VRERVRVYVYRVYIYIYICMHREREYIYIYIERERERVREREYIYIYTYTHTHTHTHTHIYDTSEEALGLFREVEGRVLDVRVEVVVHLNLPHGGVPRFRWGRIPGCYVTNFAPDETLKLIA